MLKFALTFTFLFSFASFSNGGQNSYKVRHRNMPSNYNIINRLTICNLIMVKCRALFNRGIHINIIIDNYVEIQNVTLSVKNNSVFFIEELKGLMTRAIFERNSKKLRNFSAKTMFVLC